MITNTQTMVSLVAVTSAAAAEPVLTLADVTSYAIFGMTLDAWIWLIIAIGAVIVTVLNAIKLGKLLGKALNIHNETKSNQTKEEE